MLCLDLHVMPRFTCSCAPCHVYAQIYMFMCFVPCLCLDLYLDVLRAMFMCLDLHVECYAMCFYNLLVS